MIADDNFGDIPLTQSDGSLYDREFWGITRHELIGGVAEELITSARTRDEIQRVLSPLGAGVTLADVAGWADGVKRRGPRPSDDSDTIVFLEDTRNRDNHQWHFVNLPLDVEEYSRTRYPEFTRDDDIVQILGKSVRVLLRTSDRFSELSALRLIVHMVGDVHQPIHVGCCYIDTQPQPDRLVRDPEEARGLLSDQGGNRLVLPIGGTHGVTLHSYWDSRLGGGGAHDHDAAGQPVEEIVAEAEPPSLSPWERRAFIDKLVTSMRQTRGFGDMMADQTLPPDRWAEEWAYVSVVTARSAYHSLVIDRLHTQNGKYWVHWEGRTAYDARCKPIVEAQLQRAAQNLATLLEAIWP